MILNRGPLNLRNSKSDSTEDYNEVDSTSSCIEAKFELPTASVSTKYVLESSRSSNYHSASDSSASATNKLYKPKSRVKRKITKSLPPIGIFWDIENCQVPKSKSATLVVQQLRELFYDNYREAEFIVVCDVKKESSQIISDLNDAQVNLIHVSSISKNAADEKLRQSLRRFSDLHKPPAAVALISGDINFAADLSDLRYRKKMRVILIHNNNVADALILCANETYNFTSIMERVPTLSKLKALPNQPCDLLIFNLPFMFNNDVGRLKNRLKYLSDNCGGRVLTVHKDSRCAIIRFSSFDFAKRAQKRLEGECVFGNKIQVSRPTIAGDLLFKSHIGRKIKNEMWPQLSYETYEKSPHFYKSNNLQVTNSEKFFGIHLYCFYHCPNGLENYTWGEALDISLPNINISLNVFKGQVKKLVVSHLGYLPLLSFPICYSVEFGPFPEDEFGVPLEHLITCIPNVVLTCSNQNKHLKYIQLKSFEESSEEENFTILPYLMTTNITNFCYEMIDLLKSVDNCQLLMRRYIPTYHHYFGRQCRVADYGFTRLIDLLEAVPHIIQIIGYGVKRIITLTHSAQMRRFTSDVLRLLKAQGLKRVVISNFSSLYEKTFQKTFNPVNYGLCSLEDLLSQISQSNIVITKSEIIIPTREQTPEEIKRTIEFSLEVKQLLSLSPYCSILFNKFIPAYHHHFGRQCKVSEYGFTKLVELFEAIAQTVDLEESYDMDRKVKLKLPLAFDILGDQVRTIIKESNHQALHIDDVFSFFALKYGYNLKPEAYDCKSFIELAFKLNNFVRIVHGNSGMFLMVTDVDVRTLEIRVWSLLLDPPYMCSITKFIYDYRIRFFNTLSITKIEQLKTVIVMKNNGTETLLFLTPFYILAARLYHLLFVNGGCALLCTIGDIYRRKFGTSLSPLDYGIDSLENLFQQMSFSFTIKKNGKQINIILNQGLADYGVELPSAIVKNCDSKNSQHLNWPSPLTHLFYKDLSCTSSIKSERSFLDLEESISHKNGFELTVLPLSPMEGKKVNSPNQISHANLFGVAMPKISSPHPTDLPTPDRLIFQEDKSTASSSYESTISKKALCFADNRQVDI
ncbi:hypothetical protein FQA39_LY17970 [Lamprigera yunnana]|nr:hypothetical protein FQA39_LY17970 [Lamprigera yunnana]